MGAEEYHHASCVAIAGRGILLLGPSGAGKSDVALRLIDAGAVLVADDQTVVTEKNARLVASPPEKLRGLIEACGVGILTLPYAPEAPIFLAVTLVAREEMERMPEPAFFHCFAQQVPLLSLHAFDSSVCTKIRLFLQAMHS